MPRIRTLNLDDDEDTKMTHLATRNASIFETKIPPQEQEIPFMIAQNLTAGLFIEHFFNQPIKPVAVRPRNDVDVSATNV
mgnify:CR=1 FL=1